MRRHRLNRRLRAGLSLMFLDASCSTITPVDVQPPPLRLSAPTARIVAAGFYHTCSLSTSQVVTCWGSGLGSGGSDFASVTPPHTLPAPLLSTITAGNGYTCGLTSDGQAYCWGSNADGQLGDGTRVDHAMPQPVKTELRFLEISAGGGTTCGVSADRSTYCWGDGSAGGTGDGLNGSDHRVLFPTAVAGNVSMHGVVSGFGAVCGIDAVGNAYCWGAFGSFAHTGSIAGSASRRDEGLLADSVCASYDVFAQHCARPTAVPGGVRMGRLSVGGSADCAIDDEARAVCWGDGSSGQFGNGQAGIGVRSPTPVVVSGGFLWLSVSVGGSFSCGVVTGQTTYCWGSNFRGYLGDGSGSGSAIPVLVAGGIRSAMISASLSHVCAVSLDARVYCWGADLYGELGQGTPPKDSGVPKEVVLPDR